MKGSFHLFFFGWSLEFESLHYNIIFDEIGFSCNGLDYLYRVWLKIIIYLTHFWNSKISPKWITYICYFPSILSYI